MPLKGFKYPDGETVSIDNVLKGDVDIERMGVSLPTLLHMSEQRPNDRPPSTTELLIGTCQAYLQRTADYYISPQDNAFALAGTLHHLKLEKSADGLERLLPELALKYEDITGIVDLYDSKTKTLTDYKNTGSYKISQLLGLQYKMINHPTEVYKRGGKWGRVGSPKRIKEWYANPEKADFGDWGWQINWYRLLLEKSGYPVEEMYVQATVRDGGIQMARERGIDKNIYLIPVPFIHDDHLIEKFLDKRDLLNYSLLNNDLPSMCDSEETWGGKKCEMYCPVREVCPYINKEIMNNGY